MPSSGNPQGPVNIGPDKVIWIKIPPPGGGTKRVFFAFGNLANPNLGWFDLNGRKAFGWLQLLAESMANAIDVTWSENTSTTNPPSDYNSATDSVSPVLVDAIGGLNPPAPPANHSRHLKVVSLD